MLYADMFTWLSDNLLERGDRMAMASSLETRPPFLDRTLIEAAFRLPSRFKVHKGSGKWILKEVARRYLPAEVVDRPKVGFKVPLEQWFRSGMKDFAYDLLTAPSSFVRREFAGHEVTRLLDSHQSGRFNEDIRIWTLLSLEVWHRELASHGYSL
jgi:asparagine synthase (glutamine-hydrolysing)